VLLIDADIDIGVVAGNRSDSYEYHGHLKNIFCLNKHFDS